MDPEPELDLVVARRAAVADGVITLDLRDPSGAALPAWAPGAHIDLILGSGLTRQFSLCGASGDPGGWRIAVLREPAGRGGSAYVHDGVVAGSRVRVRGPRNRFPLQPADRYLFIAGGIGITPILPMLAAADAAGRAWTLTYGGRTAASMAFRADLLARYPGQVRIRPQDETGPLDLAAILGRPQPGTLVYCCGPAPLLDAVTGCCAGWPEGALHLERFTPTAATHRPSGPAFEVELAQAGLTLMVPPGRSILDVIEAAGVPVLSSCTEGTCGTCETGVLAGVPEHRDSVLSPAEQAAADTMMICVSRSLTPRLVLDI
ncbi:MAG TPA: PDR/VanB family oxidoreductase [Streptosporangiaceae bacterium]|jgi:ferredoxin-NADP reductase|nr:PDR/VanB family oxidoreductase [Streptosporangiaceae bacterium]